MAAERTFERDLAFVRDEHAVRNDAYCDAALRVIESLEKQNTDLRAALVSMAEEAGALEKQRETPPEVLAAWKRFKEDAETLGDFQTIDRFIRGGHREEATRG
jgi:hypothetical protein